MALTKVGVYQVVSTLGDGPRGTVYLCKDRDGHKVAVRIFPATTDPEGFLQAAAVQKALTAHHLALVEDFGIQEGRPFLASERVEGEPLASWLEASHPPADQLKLIEGLLDALHSAHALGIVHARVQPSNVRVLSDGECRLLDLGASTFTPGARASPTRYVAPELAEGGAASVKNDIYSAGVICYEVLAGRPPFDPSAPSGQAQSLRALRPDLPRDLSDAVMACLDKDPEWRPKDLGYVLQVVKQLREAGLPKGARGAAPRPAGRAAPAPAARAPRPKPSDRSGPPLLPIALGLVALAAGGYLLWGRLSAPPPVGPRQGPTTTASTLPRPLPPTEPSPVASETPRAPSPSPMTTPAPVASTPAPKAATPPPTPMPARTPAVPSPAVKPEPARPTPAPTPAAVVVATPAPPAPTPSVAARTAPSPESAASDPPAGPATLTTVVPRVLKKGATGIMDIHGLGLRSDHLIRVFKGRDPAPGFTLVRQRRVNDTLIQAVVQVDAAAASGPYTLVVADGQGGLSNPLPIEVAK